MVIAVVAVAYGTAAPELGVAEFAPAARQSIEPPPTTATDNPAAGAANGRRRPTTTLPPTTTNPTGSSDSAASAPTTQLPRVRNCVGSPPRQIEDPMSPPCLGTIFDGDNGGATARGVAATEIAVAVPHGGWCDLAKCQPMVNAIFEYFNQRYELYGRRLRPVFVTGSDNNALDARAVGADIASRQVFAALTGLAEWDEAAPALLQELGRQGVVTVMRGIHASDRSLLDELHPYLWSVQPSTEQWQRNVADFTCKALVGKAAHHAGTPSMRTTTRKFGVITSGGFTSPSANPLLSTLADCGANPATIEWKASVDTSTQLRTGLESFRSAGVTTVICVCAGYYWQSVFGEIGQLAGFLPETLRPLSSQSTQEQVASATLQPSVFGVSAEPKLLPVQAMGWHQAVISVNSTLMATTGMDFIAAAVGRLTYQGLLVLAAGIQGAGPQLSPETFAAGLMSTQFSNAGAGQGPFWQPSVGFGPGDHSFYNDFSVTWWSPSAPALEPDSTRPAGSWCYVGQGTRYSTGSYPKDADELLFRTDLPCT